MIKCRRTVYIDESVTLRAYNNVTGEIVEGPQHAVLVRVSYWMALAQQCRVEEA